MRFPTERTDAFDYSAERVCRNCTNAFSGRYCNRCGERVVEPTDKSILSILTDVIQGFTFLDNKAIRTFRLMLLRTGELTRNHMEGIRVPFLKPVSVFFIANLLYFLFPVFNTFNTNLRTQMHFLPHSEIAAGMVEKRLSKEKVTLEQFTIRYQQQSTTMAKLLLIIFVLIVAVVLALINYSSHYYFHDHFLAALEFSSMLILVGQLFLPWMLTLISNLFADNPGWLGYIFRDSVFSVIIMMLSFLVFYLMEKRVYLQNPKNAVVKALLMIPGIFIALQSYRIILFFVTMWTL